MPITCYEYSFIFVSRFIPLHPSPLSLRYNSYVVMRNFHSYLSFFLHGKYSSFLFSFSSMNTFNILFRFSCSSPSSSYSIIQRILKSTDCKITTAYKREVYDSLQVLPVLFSFCFLFQLLFLFFSFFPVFFFVCWSIHVLRTYFYIIISEYIDLSCTATREDFEFEISLESRKAYVVWFEKLRFLFPCDLNCLNWQHQKQKDTCSKF